MMFKTESNLLIRFAVVYHTTCDVPALWIMMRPMDEPTFFIPDILTVETNAVANF